MGAPGGRGKPGGGGKGMLPGIALYQANKVRSDIESSKSGHWYKLTREEACREGRERTASGLERLAVTRQEESLVVAYQE